MLNVLYVKNNINIELVKYLNKYVLFWEEGGQELSEPGGFVFLTGVGSDK